jgi:hypothetical protein
MVRSSRTDLATAVIIVSFSHHILTLCLILSVIKKQFGKYHNQVSEV